MEQAGGCVSEIPIHHTTGHLTSAHSQQYTAMYVRSQVLSTTQLLARTTTGSRRHVLLRFLVIVVVIVRIFLLAVFSLRSKGFAQLLATAAATIYGRMLLFFFVLLHRIVAGGPREGATNVGLSSRKERERTKCE